MTELEAVNECLEAIRQAPVATLSGTLETEVSIALSTVRKVSKDVQGDRSWWFNTIFNGTLTPDGSSKINAPGDVLSVDWSQASASLFPTFRGAALWSTSGNTSTDVFTTSVNFYRLTFFRPFTDLPEVAQRYISLRAARVFADKILAGDGQTRSATVEEVSALGRLRKEQLRTIKPNMLQAPGIDEIAFRQREANTWL